MYGIKRWNHVHLVVTVGFCSLLRSFQGRRNCDAPNVFERVWLWCHGCLKSFHEIFVSPGGDFENAILQLLPPPPKSDLGPATEEVTHLTPHAHSTILNMSHSTTARILPVACRSSVVLKPWILPHWYNFSNTGWIVFRLRRRWAVSLYDSKHVSTTVSSVIAVQNLKLNSTR
jgi:hypothetical protein